MPDARPRGRAPARAARSAGRARSRSAAPVGALAGALTLALSAATLAPPAHAAPVQRTIRVDGDMGDWSAVLANPENVAREGDGSTLGCTSSTDRDCPIPSGDLDLARLAWTWDGDDLYVLVERYATGRAADAYVTLGLDVDHDGLLEASDFVALLRLRAGSSTGDVSLHAYQPVSPSGDPLVDGAGFADGHDMPGRLGGQVSGFVGDVMGRSPGSTTWEASIRWDRLGVPDGSPLMFHAAIASGTSFPADLRDNLGASDGKAGSTGFVALEVWPDRSVSTSPNRTVQLPHVIENVGNVPSRIDVKVRSSTGQDLTLWRDVDLDAVPETWLAYDKGGDGLLTLTGDWIAPAGDSNGDGVLDTGVLPMDGAILLFVEATYGPDSAGLVEQVDVDGWIGDTGSPSARAVDHVRVGTITIQRDELRPGVAGDVAWFPHVVQNNTVVPRAIDLSVVSTRGWSWSVMADPDRDGSPADAAPLPDSDGSGLPDVTLQPGQTAHVLARAVVPAAAPLGAQEVAFARAHLDGAPESVVADRVVVMVPHELTPSYAAATGNARYGGAGGRIHFAHRLENHRGSPQDFALSATNDAGWPVTLLDDPDADGRPYDSLPLASPMVTLGPNSGELAFIVAVDVPAGTRLGESATVTVTATPASGEPALDVVDDAVAAIVRVYSDPDHLVNVLRVPECGTAHAFASGLAPGGAFRFAWRDPSGAAFRTLPVTSDAGGTCADEHVLGPADLGDGWSVEIQQWDGASWAALDTARFDVGDGWVMRDLATDSPTFDVQAPRVSASAILANESFDGSIDDVVRWVVRTEDAASYLHADGTFQPYTGVEETSSTAVTLAAREERVAFLVSSVTFPGEGLYVLEAWRTGTCSGARLGASTTFEVLDDEDGDGLPLAVEAAAGTDPADDDSDDDALTDGLDGLEDSDGDGVVDALDCDSDDDGLSDGLEAGEWEPASGTDLGAGCFTPDAWPGSRTDPDVADTDGGGVPDGFEDADRNGRVDPGERDPLDAGDDVAGCSSSAPPEVQDLRVARAGGSLRLTWTPVQDPCVGHVVLESLALPDFTPVTPARTGAEHELDLGPAPFRAFRVRAESWLGGPGPD